MCAGTLPEQSSLCCRRHVQPPRPPELPLLGHALSMLQFLLTKGTVEDLLMEWRRQLG